MIPLRWVLALAASAACAEPCDTLPPFEATRFEGNPIIRHGGGGWKDSQVQEPCIVVDPDDPSRLVMFFAAMAAPVAHGVMSIGVAAASVDNPFEWHEDPANPIMTPGDPGAWDDRWIRLDCVVPLGGAAFRLYYTGHGMSTGYDQIGTALCTKTSGGWTITRDAANPVLAPTGDEVFVSQSAVLREGGQWYMYYSYRTREATLPGVRLAVSDDGVRFTKTGEEILSIGAEGDFDSRYIEWHQIQRVGDAIVMLYEAYNGEHWSIGMARAAGPRGPFTKYARNPILQRSAVEDAFDEDHVATPAMYCIGGRWLLFYQGANQAYADATSYSFSHWDLGIAVLGP